MAPKMATINFLFVLIAIIAQVLAQTDTATATVVPSSNSTEVFPKNVGNWSFSYPTHPKSTCVLLKGAIQLSFTSTPGNNKTFERIDVPSNAVVYGGTCGENEQSLVLVWPWPTNASVNALIFNITLPAKSKKYHVQKIEYGVIDLQDVDSAQKKSLEHGDKGYFIDVWSSGEFYSTTRNHSYLCTRNQSISGDLNILTADFQYEAFRGLKLKTNEFDSPEECKKTDTDPESSPFPKNIGKWRVNYDKWKQRSCILLTGAIQIQYLAYPGDNSTLKTIDVPSKADSVGDCGNYTWISVMWSTYDSNAIGRDHFLNFNFEKDESDNYHISRIELTISDYSTINHPGDNGYLTYVKARGEFYSAKLNLSYACNKTQITGDLTVLIADFQYEAYRPLNLKEFEFDPPVLCKEAEIADTQSPNTREFPNNVGNWSLKCQPRTPTLRSCILLTGAIQLQFLHQEGSNANNLKVIDVPEYARTFGECRNLTNCYIMLYWGVQENGTHYDLEFSFTTPPDDQTKYYIEGIKLTVGRYGDPIRDDVSLPGIIDDGFISVWTTGEFYSTHLNNSYLCGREQIISGDLTVRTASLQFEALRPDHLKEFEFDPAEECKGQTPGNLGKTTTRRTTTRKTTTQSTTPSPTTTPTPTPVEPFPKNVGNWSYEYESKNDSSCILLSGAIQLEYYTTPGNKDSRNLMNVPKDANVVLGNCKSANETQSLLLSWIGVDSNKPQARTIYLLALNFTTNTTKDSKFYISEIFLAQAKYGTNLDNIDVQTIKNGDSGYMFGAWTEGEFYPTSLNRSYQCITQEKITGNLTMLTADLKFEAFRPMGLQKYVFDEPEICKPDIVITASIVGVLVGSIIAVLIGICVGAYLGIRYGLFGKIRSRFRRDGPGYQPLNADR